MDRQTVNEVTACAMRGEQAFAVAQRMRLPVRAVKKIYTSLRREGHVLKSVGKEIEAGCDPGDIPGRLRAVRDRIIDEAHDLALRASGIRRSLDSNDDRYAGFSLDFAPSMIEAYERDRSYWIRADGSIHEPLTPCEIIAEERSFAAA